jgi:hypothetical protein
METFRILQEAEKELQLAIAKKQLAEKYVQLLKNKIEWIESIWKAKYKVVSFDYSNIFFNNPFVSDIKLEDIDTINARACVTVEFEKEYSFLQITRAFEMIGMRINPKINYVYFSFVGQAWNFEKSRYDNPTKKVKFELFFNKDSK